ncbi:PREDICTED: uncharacterized protein LOC104814927 [Tarenaya hassleriana]|uniref:uncharacterized protein LOC104814927 n=1 Tax=Tarenaya hassleriana TaxID=28532 RepID=UPI00053C6D93|nr:PREDICTED: uncharacterized protein LOC104814927 [Tarenaya hassleriana]
MSLIDSTVSHVPDSDVHFPVEAIVLTPLPGYVAPASISFSPDDTCVGCLFSPEQTLNRNVYVFDVKNGESRLAFSPPNGGVDEGNITQEEKLRRERSRERGLGVTRYEWVKTNSKKQLIVVPLPSGVYLQDLSSLNPELVLPSLPTSPIIDPRLSPNGLMLAYVRDSELHVLSLSNNKSQQLTDGANGSTVTHGLAEYIAQEEMDRRNGYWWSPDSNFIAYTQINFSEIPLFRIMHQGKSSVGSDAQEDHPYPFAGALNVSVRLGVVSSAGGHTTWMDLNSGGTNREEEYLARVNWMSGNILISQVLNRSHTKLKILKFDIKTGQRDLLFTEESDVWVTLHDCFTPLEKAPSKRPGGFIWASEKTGFRHLYLHDSDGTCLRAITRGEWMVEQLMGINESMGLVYFTATMDGPLESNLYCTKLEPGETLDTALCEPIRLTHGKGKHVVLLDHQMKNFIDIYDSVDSPPRVSLCSLHDGTVLKTLYESKVPIPILETLKVEPPEIVQIQASDGTTLYGALYKPDASRFGPPPYKTMINVYGGPGVQLVSNSWINTVDMRTQYLRSRGILVWKVDNRGASRRGLKFESSIKHNCGYVDSEDQVAGAKWLIEQGLAKPENIGVYGWSYGGYLSAMLLTRYPEIFRCAISGAPVTSWDGYDTFYTEKYMGLPSEDPERYVKSSVMEHVGNLVDGQRLLLVHGMIDENVHFRHTARLVNALVEAGKRYELLVFPDERHMPRKLKDRIYMEHMIWDFIERSL